MSAGMRALSVIAIALASGACDDNTAPENELTEEESLVFFDAVVGLVADSTLVPIHLSPDSVVVACPEGGQAKLVGGAGDRVVADTARLFVDFFITPTGCGISSAGTQFSVDGSPGIQYRLSIEIVGLFEQFNINGTIAGGLLWQLGSRSGSCPINLMLVAEPDLSNPAAPGVSGVFRGLLCGHRVEVDASGIVGL